MQESWINLYCSECGESWESKISDLPNGNGEFECKSCGHKAKVKNFLHSDRDLEVYEEFK